MGNLVSALMCRKHETPHHDPNYIDPVRSDQDAQLGFDIEAQRPILPLRREPNTLACGCSDTTLGEHSGHAHAAGSSHHTSTTQVNIGTDISPRFAPILHIEPVGPLRCNMVIVGDPTTKEAVLVDPGGDGDTVIEIIKRLGVKITKILITHAHFDHFLAAGEIREFTGAPVYLHSEDRTLWNFLPMQLRLMGLTIPSEVYQRIGKPDQNLADGDALGVLDGKCLHTPGHTPGSCSFYFAESRLLLTGDTLFNGSVGRTDLMGGNQEHLKVSIQSKLYVLPDAVTVIPGHGPKTTIGKEKNTNAVIRAVDHSAL